MVKTCGTREECDFLVPKLEKFEPLRQQRITETFRPKGKFNVLIHNDLWTNNMLFKSVIFHSSNPTYCSIALRNITFDDINDNNELE